MGVFGTSINPGNAQNLREVELAAKAFGVKLQYLDVLSPKDFETAFRAASKGLADAVLMLPGLRPRFTASTACRPRGKEPAPSDLPTRRNLSKPAGLYYAMNTPDFPRAATYVDKILKAPSPPTCRWSSRQVRVHHQSQGRQADRPDDSAERAGEGG